MILNMSGTMSPLSFQSCRCFVLSPLSLSDLDPLHVSHLCPIIPAPPLGHLNLHLLPSCAGWPREVSSVALCLLIVVVLDYYGLGCRPVLIKLGPVLGTVSSHETPELDDPFPDLPHA